MTWSGLRGAEGEEPDARKEGPEPASVQRLLSELARRKGWGRRLEGARVHERWLDIAGEQLAAHAQPVRLHGGVLVLRAESSAWATQVRYLVPELTRRANQILGEGQVVSVQIVTGQGPRGRDDPS